VDSPIPDRDLGTFEGRPLRTLADVVATIREVVAAGDDLQLTNACARLVLDALDGPGEVPTYSGTPCGRRARTEHSILVPRRLRHAAITAAGELVPRSQIKASDMVAAWVSCRTSRAAGWHWIDVLGPVDAAALRYRGDGVGRGHRPKGARG
jgi:hypothetical protein